LIQDDDFDWFFLAAIVGMMAGIALLSAWGI
jgi:hypothetical protein